MRTESIFVYGTLKSKATQTEVMGKTVDGVPDILDGFEKGEVVLSGRSYPAAKPESHHSIKGHVLEVTRDELRKIDVYETEAYKRMKVKLRSGIEAWVYQRPV